VDEALLFGGTAGIALDQCYHQACDNLRHMPRQSQSLSRHMLCRGRVSQRGTQLRRRGALSSLGSQSRTAIAGTGMFSY
jgi:hypothetical protein